MDILLVMMLLAVGGMFLLSNRAKKQQREATAFRSHLAIGDEVMTGSGLFGTVIDVDGDVITLESPSGGRTDWLREAVAKLASPPYESVAAEPESESADAESADAASTDAASVADVVDDAGPDTEARTDEQVEGPRTA